MLPSCSEILAEATSTLVKTFCIVFFLNLYYAFITYDGRKCSEQRAKSNEHRAKSSKQQAKSNEQQAKSNKQQVKSNEQRAKRNKQRAKSNEQRAKGSAFYKRHQWRILSLK